LDIRNYLIVACLIGVIALAVALVTVNGELTNLRSNVSALQADLTSALENHVNELESIIETRTPKKGYLSISSSAFVPTTSTQTYEKGYSYLKGSGIFYTMIQLPDGVNLTRMKVLVMDASTSGYIYASLNEHNLTALVSGTIVDASTTPEESPEFVWLIANTSYKVDNKNCVYDMHIYISEDTYSLYIMGVILEYEYLS
jgi:hypothetical protein